MKEKIKYFMSKKLFHVAVIIFMIAIILFFLGITVLKYSVEGETNMPFSIKKIVIISSCEGIDEEAGENRWAFKINQNNDVYFYIEKNKGYEKEEILENITIDNFQLLTKPQVGNVKIYKPDNELASGLFFNKEDDEVETLIYTVAEKENVATSEISNQGGKVAFRFALNDVSEYRSDEDEINHKELLKKAGVTNESLKTTVQMDFTMKLQSGKEFKTTISLDMPVDDVVEDGVTSQEINDKDDFVFKRIKNL